MKSNSNSGSYSSSLALLLMIFITCLSQVLTLLKSSMVAGVFGASLEMDAYNFANSIVSFLFGFIASAIPTVVIPRYLSNTNRQYIDSFITLLYGAILAIIGILLLFRYQIVGMVSKRDEHFIDVACYALVVLLLSNYLYSISDITVAFFQCKGNYNLPKIIGLISQIVTILPIIIVRKMSIIQYTWIMACGFIVSFLLDTYFAVKEGWRFKPTFLFRANETKQLLSLFFPIVFSAGIYKLSLFVDSIIAASLQTGMITILSYASQIANMINWVLVGNLLTYVYPKVVQEVHTSKYQKVFWQQASLFHLIVCLVVAGFAVVGHPAVALFFQHGLFTEEATKYVYLAALLYIAGQQTNVIRELIYRYFYAKGNTVVPARNGVLVNFVNIVTSLTLVHFIGFWGIIWGTAISSFVSLFSIIYQFKKNYGFDCPLKHIVIPLLKNVVITCVTVLIVTGAKKIISIQSLLFQILAFGVLTVIVFAALSVLLHRDIKDMISHI